MGTIATKEAPSGVGVLLEQASKKAWFVYESNACLEYASAVWGTVAAEVAVVGKKQLTNTLVLNTGIKKITLDSGTAEEPELLGSGSTPVSVKYGDELSFEEALEVT